MALVATVGGTTSNSYATRAEATTYFGDRLYSSAWDAAVDADKDKALITATRRLEQEMFLGERASTTQALKWPRLCVTNEDGNLYESDEIPARLKEAQFITAIELLKSDTLSENQMSGIKSLSTGTLSIELEPSLMSASGKLPSEAKRLLRGLIVTGGRVIRA